ncbi:immunoglobulin-like domain-containing protein [Winogradskyella sp. PE311]|uniref:immunoglobulin-like domain-containing protein n=1 Tax=Winogradskyella sp. PE311 TaxID=3366943 RepID=UPI0039800826
MKIKLLLLIGIMSTSFLFSQNKQFWIKEISTTNDLSKSNHKNLKEFHLFSLDVAILKQQLESAPNRDDFGRPSNVVISVPNYNGKLEQFSIKEASTMHPDLQARYPEIRSYVGQGLDNPSSVLRFSISPKGLSAMILSNDGESTFIDPIGNASNLHIVFNRKNRADFNDDFECQVTEQLNRSIDSGIAARNADDSILRTYRLAISATGEYTQYHGGTKAQALAAMNTTMTRVNGIYESDFNVTMQLIANTDDVIYTSTASDPYGNTTSGYNSQLQNTLTSVIGESNYDVGHLFANLQNNGNAGCIGCVCVNNQKGSGWTSHVVPEGDPFDVDYVAHELGHQFGGNHTWTFGGNEGANAQMEPGSGSTIMGYAGITGATDVQNNSDPYFHARSIEQITDYIKTTSCQTNTNTGNNVPVVDAGSNYTIPRGTAFVLEGSATDADSGDMLSYCWEQYDENNAATTNPNVNATSGVAFRSFNPSTSTDRYFPRLSTIKTGATSWQWEAVPNVARNLNFRLTVRDNQAGGGTNNSDDMIVSVNGTAGPFIVNSPNTNVTWNAGTTQSVTWNVAGTTGNGVNAANVDIFLSTDGGDTYPISLASGVPNDGSHDILVPNSQGNQNRIMVRGANNIFFDISNSNFTIAGQVVCNADVPTGLAASNVATTSATLSWTAVAGATYDLRYREVGTSTWTTVAVTGISSNVTGLSSLTQYEAQVRSKCSGGSNSAYSSSVNFTTTDVQLNYCTSASTNTNDEYISRVQLNTIDNSSGPQFYSDFTGISTTLTKDSEYTITITPTWTGTVYNEAYGVWIDYNRDGDFTDAGEQVFTQGNTQATSVSGSFTVPTGAVENSTRMRVTMRYNQVPGPCDGFTYGEVEDYTIIIEGNGPDTEAPVITLNGSATVDLNVGESYTELGATATDNIDGILTSSIVVAGDTVDTNTGGTYVVTYNVSDAAGNDAIEVIRTVTVIPDTTAPVITLNGSATVDLNVGESYTELGATATDNIDGDLTSSIVVAGDIVDTNTAGTYVVTYNVSDAAGNVATEVIRTITMIADTTAPVITLLGDATVNLEQGDSYSDLGATAIDNIDGNLTSSIIIVGDNVDTNTIGSYTITYNVSDAAGNAAVEVIRTVNVTMDGTPPVITLIGASNIDLNVGDVYNELGATATDNIDGNITANIIISGAVDTNSAGTYFVNYNVSDAAGNAANQVTRTINVIADTTPPVIVLVGNATINLIVGDTYNEQGATATDNLDGNLTSSIVIAGNVNTNAAGAYSVTYNVSDNAGNIANEVIRTVNVSDPSTGCAGGISTFPYAEGFENTLGAWSQSSADDIDWTVDANGTPSNNTGPSSATEGNFYVFVEASVQNVGYPNARAILNSPCFNLTGLSEATFSFKYHQFGATNMGSIDLEISDDDGATWTSIWNSTGNLGNSWLTANVNLDAYVGGSVQLRFNRLTGNTWQADIAIDDISLTEGEPTVVGCSGGISTFPYAEGFENTLGAWTQSSADDLNWTVDANGTPSNGTGPSSAIQGNFYIFVEASGNNTGYPNKRAIINSPCFDLSSVSTANFSFNYHQFGSNNMGTLNLEASNDNGSTWTSIWNSSGNLGNSWQSQTVNLSAYTGGSVQLRFNRLTGGTWQADIAIDNINLTTGTTSRTEKEPEVVISDDIRIYPNPVKGQVLNVKTQFTDVAYEVYNSIGQIVAKGRLTNDTINVSVLDAGVYHIRFVMEDRTLMKRFIKN